MPVGWNRALWLVLLCACSENRDKLLGDLQNPRPDKRAHAVRELASRGNPEDLVLFTQAAKDPVAFVREEAIAALAKSDDARVIDVLAELLTDSNEGVQASAAMALAALKSDKAKAQLTSQYARRGKATRAVIVQALKAANVPGAMAQVVFAEANALWEKNVRALSDGTLPERIGAAEELGKSGRAEAFSRLLPLLNSSQVMLAAAAARGLADTGDTRAAPPIAQLLKERDPELRVAACEALGRLQAPSAVSALLPVALEKSTASMAATNALRALPDSEDTRKALCDVALGGAPTESLTAAREMRQRGGCPMEPFLAGLKTPTLQKHVLGALAALGPPAAQAAQAIEPLMGSADPVVRLAALESLLEMQKLPAGFQWQALLEEEQARLARTEKREADEGQLLGALLHALGKSRAVGARALLKAQVTSPLSGVRVGAYRGLLSLSPRDDATALRGLEDAAPNVARQVAVALVRAGDGGPRALVAAARTPSQKRWVLEALLNHGAGPELAVALSSWVPTASEEFVALLKVLEAIGARQAVAPLMKWLESPAVPARRELIETLGRLGDSAASEAVARELYHDSPEIRAAAARALAMLGPERHGEALDALKGDYFRAVRQAAEEALARAQGEGRDGGRPITPDPLPGKGTPPSK